MKRSITHLSIFGAVLMALTACSIVPHTLGPLSEGELRLKSMRLPGTMQAGLSYDLMVYYEGDDKPAIKKVCFHWVSEQVSISSPSLYCYAYEVQSNQPIGAMCPRWIAEGPYTNISSHYCVNADEIRYEEPGRLVVKIPDSAVRPEYNRLVGYAEYIRNGSPAETNRVSAKTIIER